MGGRALDRTIRKGDISKRMGKGDMGRYGAGRERNGQARKKDGEWDEKGMALPGERLREQLLTLAPDGYRREQALGGIRQAVMKKTVHRRPSYLGLIVIELQYISAGFWILQGILAMALVLLLEMTALEGGGLRDYLQWTSVLAAWLGVVGCGSLGRHFSRGMAELEQSCYFNLPQIWTIKMALSGTMDILFLALCSGRIAEEASVPFVQVCVYVLAPFVLSSGSCRLVFTALRGSRGRYGQLVMAFVTGIFAAIPNVMPVDAYREALLWVWVLALACGIVICLWQLRRMYGGIRRGETVCWN